MTQLKSGQRGFGAIAAIVLLVVMAAMAGGIVAVSSTQHQASAQDVMSAKAWMAARAGSEYGLYQALKGSWTTCASQSQTLDLRTDTGFYVTVSCDSQTFKEGEELLGGTASVRTVRVFEIKAVACPQTSCPASGSEVAGAFYVERSRQVIATDK